MKTTWLLSTVLVLGTIPTTGQDCKTDELVSLANLKGAIQRVTKQHVYLSFDDKAFGRSGDQAAVAIVKTIPDSEMVSPNTVKAVLSIVHMAFACPSRCVTALGDRQPNVTLLLLEHLHNRNSGQVQSEIDETREYILEQTRDLEL
jgi:hypothetical protein